MDGRGLQGNTRGETGATVKAKAKAHPNCRALKDPMRVLRGRQQHLNLLYTSLAPLFHSAMWLAFKSGLCVQSIWAGQESRREGVRDPLLLQGTIQTLHTAHHSCSALILPPENGKGASNGPNREVEKREWKEVGVRTCLLVSRPCEGVQSRKAFREHRGPSEQVCSAKLCSAISLSRLRRSFRRGSENFGNDGRGSGSKRVWVGACPPLLACLLACALESSSRKHRCLAELVLQGVEPLHQLLVHGPQLPPHGLLSLGCMTGTKAGGRAQEAGDSASRR